MTLAVNISAKIFRQFIAAILSTALGISTFADNLIDNRKQMSSSLAPIPAGLFNYDANDRFTAGDTYDNNGNTISSGGIGNVYDFENHLIQKDGVTLKYDGDGNRVFKTVAGVTTGYMVDDRNPTGYVQVLDEVQSGSISRAYVYGLEMIEQDRISYPTQASSFNLYDGHGSVRALTNLSGAVSDTYDYDAFGNLIHSTGATPNVYLYSGEQFDPDLHLYYNRARYLNVTTGRFWTPDVLSGKSDDPTTLHKFLYAHASPLDRKDPSGNFDFADTLVAGGIANVLNVADLNVGASILEGFTACQRSAEDCGHAVGVAYLVNSLKLLANVVFISGLTFISSGSGRRLQLAFTQKTFSPQFGGAPQNPLRRLPVTQVANRLITREMLPSQLPVKYVVGAGGKALIVNTRSAAALSLAKIPPSQWTLIDASGDPNVASEIFERRLPGNELDEDGIDYVENSETGELVRVLDEVDRVVDDTPIIDPDF